MSKIQIICHGGAWAIPDATEQESLCGVREAAAAGYAALREGKAAEDAVVAAVMTRDFCVASDCQTFVFKNSFLRK